MVIEPRGWLVAADGRVTSVSLTATRTLARLRTADGRAVDPLDHLLKPDDLTTSVCGIGLGENTLWHIDTDVEDVRLCTGCSVAAFTEAAADGG